MESIIDASFDHINVVANVLVNEADRRRISHENQITRAETHIVILQESRPIAGKGIFQAGADRPPIPRGRGVERVARADGGTASACQIELLMRPGESAEDVE